MALANSTLSFSSASNPYLTQFGTAQKLHPCSVDRRERGTLPGVTASTTSCRSGGADAVENMQWQCEAEGRAKDRVE
jgi:hypothetical protein